MRARENAKAKTASRPFKKLFPDSEAQNRWADKLFRVHRRPGRWDWLWKETKVEVGEQLVLAHVEFQNQQKTDLELRVVTTGYRVFDRFQKPVVSFVVLGDDRPKWRPKSFGWKLWGYAMGVRFPTVKLLSYTRRWRWLDELRRS